MPVMRQYVNTLALTCRLAGEWISSKGCWRIPITHYNALLSGLKSIPNVQLTVDPLPPAADLIVKVKTHCCCCFFASASCKSANASLLSYKSQDAVEGQWATLVDSFNVCCCMIRIGHAYNLILLGHDPTGICRWRVQHLMTVSDLTSCQPS